MKKTDARPSVPPSARDAGSLEDLFEHARDDGFSRGEMNELWSRVGVVAPVTPGTRGAGTSPAGPSALTAAGTGVKTIAALLVAGGLVAAGGIAHLWQSSSRARSAPLVVTAAAPVRGRETSAPVVGELGPLPRVVDVGDLPSVQDAPRAGPTVRTLAGVEGRERAAQTQRLPEPGEAHASAQERTAAHGVSAVAPPSQGAGPADDKPGAGPTIDQAPSEGALLLQARREVTTDPAGALSLAQEHARRFPDGALVPEREVLAIEALARLGRTSEARRRLDSFRARFPQSPHVARLDALIATP